MLHIQPKQYGVFTVYGIKREGYVARYYVPAIRGLLVTLLKLDKNTPEAGYILFDKTGNAFAIPDDVQDYKQIRLKSELRKAFEDYAKQLDDALRNQNNISTEIDMLYQILNEKLAKKDECLKRDSANLILSSKDIRAIADNDLTLNQIAKALRQKLPHPRFTEKSEVQVQDNAIAIISKIPVSVYGDTHDEMLANTRNFFSVEPQRYPKHIGRYRVTLEDDIATNDKTIYTHCIKIYYPAKLTCDDIKATISTAKLIGLLPAI